MESRLRPVKRNAQLANSLPTCAPCSATLRSLGVHIRTYINTQSRTVATHSVRLLTPFVTLEHLRGDGENDCPSEALRVQLRSEP